MESLAQQKKLRRLISPKVTQTTVTSIHNTPFPILHHHMDASQVKQTFTHYHNQLSPKIYAYNGELRRLCRTPERLKQSFHSPQAINEYKQPPSHHSPQPHSSPYSPRQMQKANSHYEYSEDSSYQLKQSKSTKIDQDIKKIADVTRKLKEEADRYKAICKEKVRNQLHKSNDGEYDALERDIRKLKLSTLKLQKDKLQSQLRNNQHSARKQQNYDRYHYKSSERHIDRRQIWNEILLEKPRYRYNPDPNTDSQFSSFEL